jgi:hypothetical protein
MRLYNYLTEDISLPYLEKLKIEKPRTDSILVKVNVFKFDKEWSKEKDFYIGKGGSGNTIGNRYERFKEILEMPEEKRKRWLTDSPKGNIIASSVSVDDEGRISFGNGRHRYSVLRDMGMKEITVAMTKKSVKNAKKYGYIK